MASSTDGKWITVNGAHIFIKNGQSISDAVKGTIGKSAGWSPTSDSVKKLAESMPVGTQEKNGAKGIVNAVAKNMDKGMSYKDALSKVASSDYLKDLKDGDKCLSLAKSTLEKKFSPRNVVEDYKSSKLSVKDIKSDYKKTSTISDGDLFDSIKGYQGVMALDKNMIKKGYKGVGWNESSSTAFYQRGDSVVGVHLGKFNLPDYVSKYSKK